MGGRRRLAGRFGGVAVRPRVAGGAAAGLRGDAAAMACGTGGALAALPLVVELLPSASVGLDHVHHWLELWVQFHQSLKEGQE